MYRICFDLDGVICELKREGQSYEELLPKKDAVSRMRTLKSQGCYIIIHTARHMKTCDGNPGRVMARVGDITLQWLLKHEVPFDEILFGKPWAHVYVDDNGLRFTDWNDFPSGISDLPISSELQNLQK